MAAASPLRRALPGLAIAGLVASALSFACAPDADPPSAFRGTYNNGLAVPAPLDGAHCEILVEEQGVKDMETDYLPHVVMCENGGANFEALKAQAIAARSVAYYYVEKEGSVCDSQGCQVYSCAAEPSQEVYDAVAATSGIYLSYSQTLTYAFYVAGDNGTAPPSCVGESGGTEGFVTYNDGKTGDAVEQTTLGWVFEPGEVGYGQNRGCMSQWGARCLENHNDYDYEGILRFYYGQDINIVQAQGECVEGGESESGESGDDASTSSSEDEGAPTSSSEGGTETGAGTGSETEDCPIGAEDCPCTLGGGCDPGLVCEDGICGPETQADAAGSGEGSAEADADGDGDGDGGGDGDDTGVGDEIGDELGGDFGQSAFEVSGAGCACSTQPGESPRGGLAFGILRVFGLLGGLLGLRLRRASTRASTAGPERA